MSKSLLSQHTQPEIDAAINDLFQPTKKSDWKFQHPDDMTPEEKLSKVHAYTKKNRPSEIVHETIAKLKRDSRNEETDMVSAICRRIVKDYPGTIFTTDFAAGLKLSPFIASVRSSQSCEYKYPDITILEPRGGYFGLIIEAKTLKGNPFKVDGVSLLKNEHTEGQALTLQLLRNMGYCAYFGIGENKIWRMIKRYKAMPLTPFNLIK